MSKLRVNCFSVSLDGFGAGPDQSLDHPLGVKGGRLHAWMYPTDTFKKMIGKGGGETGPDNDLTAASMENVGAWIMGRNMFGPIRGPWPDDEWRGWWGDNPPYHTPVFVLTNHPREPVVMEGGTTFHFVTDGIRAALDLARDAADGLDVRVGGGASTIRQYLTSRLLDEIHLAIAPVLLGSGEQLLAGIDMPALGYKVTKHINTPNALHVIIEKA